MASVDKKNLHFISIDKNIITCPLCMKHFQEPKLLACLHTACKKCLQSLYDHGNQPKELECPNCDVKTLIDKEGGVAKLQDNYYVRYLIKQVREQRMEDLCETCQNTAATVRCSTCVIKLCGVCADQHMQNKDMVHELSFLLEDDVHKKELDKIEHASQGSRASVHSMNTSASQLKVAEEKDLPFEFYCDTCKSKECEHCENMKNVARNNLTKPEVRPEDDPYPEPPSQFFLAKPDEPVTDKEHSDGTMAETQAVMNGSHSSQQEALPEGIKSESDEKPEGQNVAGGEIPDGVAVANSDPVTPEDDNGQISPAEQAAGDPQTTSLGSKASLHSQQHSEKVSVHSDGKSGNVSLHRSVQGENPNIQETLDIRPVSQSSQRSRESEPMTPRAEPLNEADRQALDVSQTSQHSSPRDGSITPTPDDNLPVAPSVPPQNGYITGNMENNRPYGMPDPPGYDPRMMRQDGYALQTVPEHEMEGVETSRDYNGSMSPDQASLSLRQAQAYSPIQPYPKPAQSQQGMPKVSVSAPFGFPVMKTDYSQEGEVSVAQEGSGQVRFPRPNNWPTFDERMSMSQDESQASASEEVYLTKEEAQQLKQKNLQQQFDGMVKVQPSLFPTQNFTIGTHGTGASGQKRKTAKPIRAQSAKGRAGGGSANAKVKKPETQVKRSQSTGSAPASLVRKEPSPYHEKIQRETPAKRQPNTWAHTANVDMRRGNPQMQYDHQEPRSSTPTDTKAKNGKKQNRLGFSVQRAAPGNNQPKGRVVFPELPSQSTTGKKGGIHLKPMGTEYFANTKRAAGTSQAGRNLQRPKSSMRINPESPQRLKQTEDDSGSLTSEESDMVHDPVLRQMQYEDENIFEGDPVLRSMAKFHSSGTHPVDSYPYPDHDNSVSMASDNRDDDATSQISIFSNDMDRKKSKMGLNIRSTGTMFDTFVPMRFNELIREDDDPILYDIEHTMQCITAMPAYEGYSLEELRYNDYTNFEEHTKGLLRKNYSLVHSVLQTGFKLDKLPENKVSPEKFAPEEKTPGKIHSTWPFEVDTKIPSSKTASVQGDTSVLNQSRQEFDKEHQLNSSQLSNKSQRSTKSQSSKQAQRKDESGKATKEEVPRQGTPQGQPEAKPSSEAPKKRNSKSSQEGISITEILNGNIRSQPASRASSRPNSKPPSRPGSRIGEAPGFEPPPSPDRGAGMADFRPMTPNSARQSLPNSARKMEHAGITRTPSPQEIFEAMQRSQEGPFVTTGSHPNSPVPVVMDVSLDGSQRGSKAGSVKSSQPKLVFTFNSNPSKEDHPEHCLAFGLPEMFGGLTIWEKWSLFQATKHYIPTLLGAAKEYWATRGRPKYSSRLQLGASLQRKKPSQNPAQPSTHKSSDKEGQTQNVASTLDVKFEAPIICHRTKPSSGENNSITQINCISAMKELEDYSLEELRLGDYMNWGYVIEAEATLCTEQVLEAILLKNAHEKMC